MKQYINPRAKVIIEQAIRKANKHFSPSMNQSVEELSGSPSDREAYDYAGTEQEQKGNCSCGSCESHL